MDITIGGITYHAQIPEWDMLYAAVHRIEDTVDRIEAKVDKLVEEDEQTVVVKFKIGPVSDQKEN